MVAQEQVKEQEINGNAGHLRIVPTTEYQANTFSYYAAPITNTHPLRNISIEQLYGEILSDLHKRETERHRNLSADQQKKNKDKAFDYITPNGIFSERGDRNLLVPSGYFVVDIDGQSDPKLIEERMREDVIIRPVLFYRSPGNNGIKAFYRIDTTLVDKEADGNRMHIVWTALDEYFKRHYADIIKPDKKGNFIDPSGKDLSRACFVCHDASAYFNPVGGAMVDQKFVDTYQRIDRPIRAAERKVSPATTIQDLHKRHLMEVDNHTPQLLSFVCACIKIGEDQETVLRYINEKVHIALNSSKADVKTLELWVAGIYAQYAQQYGDLAKLTPVMFAKGPFSFKYSKDARKFVLTGLYMEGVRQCLQQAGFAKRYTAPRASIFIRQEGAIIREVSTEEMRDYFTRKIEQYDELNFEYQGEEYRIPKEALRETYFRNSNNIFNETWLEHLRVHDIPIIKDTRDCSYFLFKNALFIVSGAGINKMDWSEVKDCCVWEDQLIKHEFNYLEDNEKGNFTTFFYNINNQDPERILAMASAMGYLMHNYFSPAAGQAVIFYDEAIADIRSPQGGTGKGLLANSLKQVRKVAKIDGKHLNNVSQFKWELVTPSTQAVWIDDPKPDFDFSFLYSNLTDGWTIERKHLSQFQILPEDSPKVLICSNAIIRNGKGSSNIRRQYVYELSNHYSSQIIRGDERPIEDEHGGIFFSEDWAVDEWNLFFSFMIDCATTYFQKGVILTKAINVEKNRLLQATNEEFVNWCTEQAFSLEVYETKELYEKCYNAHFEGSGWFTRRTFTDWLKLYADFRGWKVTCFQSNNVPKIRFEAKG